MRKGIVLSSIFEKGGTGKSTITYNLAYYLSQKYKVLVIDLDGQSADITYFMLGEDKLKSRDSMKTIKSVFENSMTLDNVILTVKDNLDLIRHIRHLFLKISYGDLKKNMILYL